MLIVILQQFSRNLQAIRKVLKLSITLKGINVYSCLLWKQNKTKQKKLVRLEIADGIDMVVLA